MHVISRKPFKDAALKYPNDAKALEEAYKILRNGDFNSPNALKKMFPTLDNFKYKDKWWIIDIGGNHLRLMAFIQFAQNRIYVKHIVTHAEYDKLYEQYRRGER